MVYSRVHAMRAESCDLGSGTGVPALTHKLHPRTFCSQHTHSVHMQAAPKPHKTGSGGEEGESCTKGGDVGRGS